MLSLQSLSGCSARPLNTINRINSSVHRIMCIACWSSNSALGLTPGKFSGQSSGYSGVKIEETVSAESGKIRLDTWISSRIDGISRARVQSSIRSGLVFINGSVVNKVSYLVRNGDKVSCTVAELQPLRAEPEDIPLDIVHEDEHVLVVNKPAHMVVHPAPGNATGTLVNGILGHCQLPTPYFSPDADADIDGDSSDEVIDEPTDQIRAGSINSGLSTESVRPGIVHRLDKGTSGLLVIAKDEYSHSHLAKQFKEHSIRRVYMSITCGVPSPVSGRVDVPVGRDANNRIRMVAIPGSAANGNFRHAVSRYKVVETLAGGGCALVEWRLETGRTHQIRAHAKYLGCPLLGDDVYGGSKNMALSLLQSKNPRTHQEKLTHNIDALDRPCLHAFVLGFVHPHTGENLNFSLKPPADFRRVLDELRGII